MLEEVTITSRGQTDTPLTLEQLPALEEALEVLWCADKSTSASGNVISRQVPNTDEVASSRW